MARFWLRMGSILTPLFAVITISIYPNKSSPRRSILTAWQTWATKIKINCSHRKFRRFHYLHVLSQFFIINTQKPINQFPLCVRAVSSDDGISSLNLRKPHKWLNTHDFYKKRFSSSLYFIQNIYLHNK